MDPELKYRLVSVLVLLVPIVLMLSLVALIWVVSVRLVDEYNDQQARLAREQGHFRRSVERS